MDPHPLDRVFVRDLLVRGVIGLNDWERRVEQDIVVNLVLYTDTRAAAAGDDPALILDYKAITKAVIAHVAVRAPLLVETLAEEIAALCLARGARRVTVTVEKPGAVRFARSVGVEITREGDRRGDGDGGGDVDGVGAGGGAFGGGVDGGGGGAPRDAG